MANDETVNERGSNGKITTIFQTQPLPFNNGITITVPIVPFNRYRSAWIAHAWCGYVATLIIQRLSEYFWFLV